MPESAPAPQDKQLVVRSFYERLDAGDKQAIFDLPDLDAVFRFPTQVAHGAHGCWSVVSQIGVYIPDYQHVLEDLSIGEADDSIVEAGCINVLGTTDAGQALEFPGSARYRVVDGRITEAWISSGQKCIWHPDIRCVQSAQFRFWGELLSPAERAPT